MRIAVTGGTGYLGSRLCRRLQEQGHEVRTLSRSHGCDLTRKEGIQGVFRSCDAVFHLAALVQSRPGQGFQKLNVEALKSVFEECQNSLVSRVVYVSSFTTFGPSGLDPRTEEPIVSRRHFFHDYDRTKYEGLQIARTWKDKIPLEIIYPGVIYGPGPLTEGNILTRLLHRWYRTRLAPLPGMGQPVWNFVYIDDVAEGLLLHLQKGAGEDFILGGENRSLRDLAEAFRRISKRKTVILPMPGPLFFLGSYFEDFQSRLRGTPPLVLPSTARFFVHDWKLSSQKARTLLGYSPRPLENGLKATWEWMNRELIG